MESIFDALMQGAVAVLGVCLFVCLFRAFFHGTHL